MLQKGVLFFRKRIDNKEDYIIFAEIVHLFLREVSESSSKKKRLQKLKTLRDKDIAQGGWFKLIILCVVRLAPDF